MTTISTYPPYYGQPQPPGGPGSTPWPQHDNHAKSDPGDAWNDPSDGDIRDPDPLPPYAASDPNPPPPYVPNNVPPSNGNSPGAAVQPLPPKPAPTAGGAPPSDAGKVISTGTGNGHFFNITNHTGERQTFVFSAGSNPQSGYSNDVLQTMVLNDGETATFEAGDDVPGIRISTAGDNGETKPDQVLFEDTIGIDPMGSGKVVHNPDVSAVAGRVGYNGRPEYITVSDGSRTIGDGTTTGVYDFPSEDHDPNSATNPMNMALNHANSYDIVFWQ